MWGGVTSAIPPAGHSNTVTVSQLGPWGQGMVSVGERGYPAQNIRPYPSQSQSHSHSLTAWGQGEIVSVWGVSAILQI